MDEEHNEVQGATEATGADIRPVIMEVIQEFVSAERAKAEPAYKVELTEERKRREQLERRVNELVAENKRSRQLAEETERHAAIRDELRRLGVSKIDLGFRAVRDDIVRTPDGQLMGRGSDGEMGFQEYLARFTQENPELLPARITGGSGAGSAQDGGVSGAIDLNSIKPGMDPEQLDRIRREIARVVSHTVHKD